MLQRRIQRLLILTLLGPALSGGSASDQSTEAYSPVVGTFTFDCQSGTDTLVSIPLRPRPRWLGALEGAPSDLGSGLVRIELQGSPDFQPGELLSRPHLVVFGQGSVQEGRHCWIAAHSATSLDLEATSDQFQGVLAGDLVEVFAGWNLPTLFPPATQNTFHLSTGNLAGQRRSELLLFEDSVAGTNLAPSRRFFVTSEGWFEAGTYAPADDVQIPPHFPFIIRHRPEDSATRFTCAEQVYPEAVVTAVRVTAGRKQDSTVALPRPIPVKVADLDLESLVAESSSNDPADRADELHVFDNLAPGQNKAPVAKYFRSGGHWVKDTAGYPEADDEQVPAASVLLIRKQAAVADGQVLWVNHPRYDVKAP